MARQLAFVLALLSACEVTPSYVRNDAEVDAFLVRSQFKSACVALKMDREEDESLRRYATTKLVTFDNETTNACICESLYHPNSHRWDEPTAEGLKGTRRDDLAACLAKALDDPEVKEKEKLVHDLGAITAPAGFEALGKVAGDASFDAKVRAGAVFELRPSDAHVDLLVKLLGSDGADEVRTAAAEALKGRDAQPVVDALAKAAIEDSAGTVRAAALPIIAKRQTEESDAIVCKMMADDPDAAAREAAVKAFKGTKRDRALACLVKKIAAKEESPEVRDATMDALKASPSDQAALALCDAIGPFLRNHVIEKVPEHMTGADIIKAQNDRDWKRSYECVQKALRQGGYSCYAQNYLGRWMRELGGSAAQPWCPGLEKNE